MCLGGKPKFRGIPTLLQQSKLSQILYLYALVITPTNVQLIRGAVFYRYSPRRNPDRVASESVALVGEDRVAGSTLAVQKQSQVFWRDQRLRGEGTSSVDLPQNWAIPKVQSGDGARTMDDQRVAAGVSELENENEALRKSLELLEENASLRRRIDELGSR